MPIGEEWVHVPGKSLSAFLIGIIDSKSNFESEIISMYLIYINFVSKCIFAAQEL